MCLRCRILPRQKNHKKPKDLKPENFILQKNAEAEWFRHRNQVVQQDRNRLIERRPDTGPKVIYDHIFIEELGQHMSENYCNNSIYCIFSSTRTFPVTSSGLASDLFKTGLTLGSQVTGKVLVGAVRLVTSAGFHVLLCAQQSKRD